MTWYVAQIILECQTEASGQAPRSVEEQVRVLTASDDEDAYRKALRLGRSSEHEYDNSEGESVRWVYSGLSDLDELPVDHIEDGSEITSRIFQDAESGPNVKRKEELTLFLTKSMGKAKANEILGVDRDESTH